MKLTTANELDNLKQNLKRYFKTFQQHSSKIQEELDQADTPPQDDYDAESAICRDVEEEVYAARTILKTKQMEWEIIKNDEEMEKAL
jgi:hypothetical protein